MKKFGIFLFVLGWILFFVMMLGPSSLRGPLTLPVLAVCIGGGVFLYGHTSKKIRNGPLAVGKLVSLRQSIIHDRGGGAQEFILTIQFFTQEGRQVTATVVKTIEPIDLSNFQPGKRLAIRYDSQNPQNIMIVTDAVDPKLLRHAENQYYLATGQTTQEKVNIMEKGVHAKGVIVASTPTGKIVNDLAELQLRISVVRPDASTFEVTTTKAVSHDNLPFTVPGSVVHVYYLPLDEQHIVIGFHA